MKRILIAALAALLSLTAVAVPISQISPTGSTSGQAILSSGPTTAPAWGTVSLSTLTGIVPVAHGGTGAAAAGGAALDNISGFTTTGFVYRNSANSYVIITPPIIQGVGGTGLANLAAHQLVVGGSGNAMTALAVGTAGQVLVSGGAAADPAFANSGVTLNQPNIVGVTANTAATAGSVGQVLEANASTISMTSASAGNVICESLTAGDWEVSGYVSFSPAASTTVSTIITGVSTTSATLPVTVGSQAQLSLPFSTGANQAMIAPTQNFLLASTTNVCLVAFVTFGVSTLTASGRIHAVRIH